jgi:hypothetical protein
MSRRPLVLTAAAAATALLALFAWPSRPGHAPAARAASAIEAASAAAPAGGAAAPAARRAARARYRLSSTQRAVIDGREQASVVVEGTWTTTERADGRTEARFAATRIDVRGDKAPSAADVADPIELVSRDGVLAGIAFEGSTPRAARALLTGLATTFQSSERPGASWTVEEEDLLGRYVAEYQRSADRVTRRRGRYLALRGAGGLSADHARALVPSESTELRFDDHGLVSATVRIGSTMAIGKGKSALSMSLVATLVREAADDVPLVAGLSRDAAPISDHLDRAALARSRDEALVAGKDAPELLAEAARAAHLDRVQPDAGKERALALRRLSALVQLDGEAAGAIAGALRRDPRDGATASLLLGALSSADAPAATNALASLLEDDSLPPEARSLVLTHLALARTPTAESAAALTKALAGPSGAEAALALGAQARGLDDDGVGDDAIDQLLARYAQASDADEKRLDLLALANTGSRRVLPVMISAVRGNDFELARVATYGLRLIPGDDVDELLVTLIQGGSPEIMEAIQAAGYRSPAVWKPRLEAARGQFAGQKRVADALQAVLARWANL